MALSNFSSVNYNRPLSVVTAAEAALVGGELTVDDTADKFTVNIGVSVSSSSKLLARVVIPTEFNGYQWRCGAQFLIYPGDAANYVNGTTPAVGAATNASSAQITWGPYIDLNAFYAAAGDAQS